MRVALIAPPWLPVPPPAYGGTEEVVDSLARGLAAAGHEVLLATTGDSTCPVERTWVHDHARTARWATPRSSSPTLLHAYEAVGGVDMVHDHPSPDRLSRPYGRAPRWSRPSTRPFTDDTAATTGPWKAASRSWPSPTTTPRPPATSPSPG